MFRKIENFEYLRNGYFVTFSFKKISEKNMPNLVTGFNKALITLGMRMSLYSYFGLMKHLPVTILEEHNNNSKYNPLYYVVKETENNNLWVVTRGSASLDDWLTDFDFKNIDVSLGGVDYQFHRGFYKAAQNVYANVKHYIEEHDGPIYFTGHSYGASVSTALIAIAKADFNNKDLNTVAFAPAPTMGSEIPADVFNKIATIVNSNDIVPTLSVANAFRTFKDLITDCESPQELIYDKIVDFAEQIKSLKFLYAEELGEALKLEAFALSKAIADYKSILGDVEYVSGTVYHIDRKNPKALSETIEDQSQTINKLSLSLDAVINHEGNMYLLAIRKQKDA